MMKKIFAILSLLTIIAIHANAQYYPLFSQYLSNGMLINPAYTGSRDVLSINAMHRTQMVGFKGAPSYQSFTAHMPLKKRKCRRWTYGIEWKKLVLYRIRTFIPLMPIVLQPVPAN